MPYHTLLYQQFMTMIDDYLVIGFCIFVFVDILTGYLKAWQAKLTNRKLNSTKGLFGLAKHTVVIVSMLMIYPFLLSIGMRYVAWGLIAALTLDYIVSITENCKEVGIKLPVWLTKHLTKAQNDYNAEDYNPLTGAYKRKEEK